MSYKLKLTGAEVDRNTTFADITRATIAEMNAIVTSSGKVGIGQQCHVLDIGDGTSGTYIWTGVMWNSLKLFFVDFDTSVTIVPQEGRIGWDADAKTVTVGLANGVVLQLGQELYIPAKNVTGVQINNGEVVYISGASGNRPEVMLANAGDVSGLKTIAIATENIGSNQNGLFTTNGIVRDIDTSAWSEGDTLYLSTTSGVISNVQVAKGNYCVCIGYVVRSHAVEGQIIVRISSVPKLGELSDVDLSGLLDGDQVYYDNTTGVWKRIEAGFNAISRWDDIALSSDALRSGSIAPDLVNIPNTGLTIRAFDGGNTTEVLDGGTELYHNFKLGTSLRPHIHWCPTTTGAGNVKWQLEYVILDVGDAITNSTTISAIDSAGGVAFAHQVFELPVISTAGFDIGAQIKFRVFRVPSDAQDTYSGDAGLFSFGFHYEIDGDGSREVFSK